MCVARMSSIYFFSSNMIFALVPIILVLTLAKFLFWFNKRPVGHGELKKRIGDVLTNQQEIKYDLLSFDMTKLTGWKFKFLIWFSYTRFGKYVVAPLMMKKSNLHRMAEIQMHENPTFFPKPTTPPSNEDYTHTNQKILAKLLDASRENDGFHFPTVADYVGAYRSGKSTPTSVAEAVLAAVADSDKTNPPLRAVVQSNRSVVLAMASASTQRWKEGKTLSIIDGVPVAIKEEFRCEPYEFRSGASYIPIISEGVPESTIVQKLKKCGAVIIGVTNMQEYGTGTLGSNPHPPHLTTRNPYNPECYPGGSSSGSAASVAAGFCPIAIGADGGGSIRIPASLCGVVGLKPTFGLIDPLGILPKAFTIGSCGPLTSSVLDTAITMDIISQETNGNKKLVSLEGLGDTTLGGLKVGIYWDHFEHADKESTLKCKAALSQLKNLGAELVDIIIPEMEDSRVAHVVSIGAEMSSSFAQEINHHYSELNLETHLLASLSYNYTATEYINSQKQRTRAIVALESIFETVDVIVTPASACPAPPIDPEAIPLGVLDAANSGELMRFSFLANLTGIPGLVLPVGYTSSGLPVNLQVMGRWYQENVLLKIGWALEQTGAFPAKKPKVFYDVIGSD